MDIKIIPRNNGKDGYRYKIDGVIDLEISKTAISVLKFDSLPTNKQIEDLMKKLLNKKSRVKRILIDSNVCRVDDEIIFQTNELTTYEN